MAITFFGTSSNPADNGTLASANVQVTPPASMVDGDLAVLYAYQRGSSSFSISQSGGQTWNSQSVIVGGAAIYGQIFWTRFTGSWTTNPGITFSVTTNTSVVMNVFRPTTGSNLWAIANNQVTASVAAPSTPFTVTITGVTSSYTSSLTFAIWQTADNNTWGSLTGSGWISTGNAQYRNLAGNDASTTYAHFIHTGSGSTGDVSKNQLTLGGDNTSTSILTFYEYQYIPPVTGSRRIFMIS